MKGVAFGKSQCLAGKAWQALAQGVKPALNMSGLAFDFRDHAMLSPIKDMAISLPAVTKRGTMDILVRQLPPELNSTVLRTITNPIGDDLASAPTQGQPQPALLSLAADIRPQFIQLQPIIQLRGQQAAGQRRFPPHPSPQPATPRPARQPQPPPHPPHSPTR